MHDEFDLQQPGFVPGNIAIVHAVRESGYRHSFRSGRARHGFVYLVRGKLTYQFFGEQTGVLHLQAGELLFAPKGCRYTATYTEDNSEVQVIHFDLIEGDLPEYLAAPLKLQLPQAKDSLNAFFSPGETQTVRHPFYYLSCLYHLLWQIDSLNAHIPQKYRKLKTAMDAMSQRLGENQSVSCYARLCGLSEGSFRRLFREYTGSSPIEYRNNLRLSHARSLLQSGEYNVSEAALLCGFTNLSFFTRLYKRKFGYTPREE